MKFCFFTIFTLISLQFHLPSVSSASEAIHHSCKQASKRDPYLDYDFCVESLTANSKSKNTTLKKLLVISMEVAKTKATNISYNITKHLKNRKLERHVRVCLETCLELYLEAVPNLEEALSAIKDKDYSTANVEVSSAMDAPMTCEEGFKEWKLGVNSLLTKENDDFFQLTAISLAFINMCD